MNAAGLLVQKELEMRNETLHLKKSIDNTNNDTKQSLSC